MDLPDQPLLKAHPRGWLCKKSSDLTWYIGTEEKSVPQLSPDTHTMLDEKMDIFTMMRRAIILCKDENKYDWNNPTTSEPDDQVKKDFKIAYSLCAKYQLA